MYCCGIAMGNDIIFARGKYLCHLDLKATDEGYSLYRQLGFNDTTRKYKDMRLEL